MIFAPSRRVEATVVEKKKKWPKTGWKVEALVEGKGMPEGMWLKTS